jgi:hypothetical protein
LARDLEVHQVKFDQGLRERDALHEQNVVDLKEKIISLESDLVDNSDDFRPATDEALKIKFRDLKLNVETITEPFNLGVNTIPHSTGLDPDGFLAREKGQLRFLLRSLVWEKLIDGFFSAPYGFGALGSRDGKRMLGDIYRAWIRIFDSNKAERYGQEDFEIFRTQLDANKWRSATFQSIFVAVFPKGQRKGQAPGGGMVRAFDDNCERVYGEIHSVLSEVCTKGIPEEIEEYIMPIVRVAGELSLEFGSQRALLGLEGPERDSMVQIGQGFVDCVDGDGNRGKMEQVDLTVSPKLFRIGDGRNDLKKEKIIFPGEIYPRRE